MANLTEEIRKVDFEDNHFKNVRFSLLLVGISLLLALFKTQFVPAQAIGLGNILFYMIALIPIAYLGLSRQVLNRYTYWFLPIVLVWIADIFIYNNTLTQEFLPLIVVGTIVILYLTSMHKVDYLYQTLIPRLLIAFSLLRYLRVFTVHIFSLNPNYSIYKRVLIGILITVPFIGIFLTLFMNADTNFNIAVNNVISFFAMPQLDKLVMIPVYFLIYLSLFLYSYLNRAERPVQESQKSFDMVIVGIFLGALNLLFVTFLVFQIAYLFGGKDYIAQSGISPAQFAREGFFQLAWVIGLVVVIFLAIMRRYQGELSIKILMSLFMMQTIIMGVASLTKMQLYQTLMGMTTLRYYVEWFEYFLIAVLVVGIVFTLLRQSFHLILNTVTAMGLIAFTVVSSLNVDYMIASHNIEQFKGKPEQLDMAMLSNLSIDALPALKQTPVMVTVNFPKDSCRFAMQYHYGRCELIRNHGDTQLNYVNANERISTYAFNQ
ncbi:DUF4153 domain-containing protein [uncultured Sulfuricurvum sp.]|uniref:DUF4153 domain-containing protein n=1 Tax=uncultured Sulfuricurvum sp. TaxID=430693 RepID=UPI0026133529|nr:DUF4173 domain-containing protein [uncultured Sulfuricurvum sp.]